MTLLKTYSQGEPLPEGWRVTLHWRDDKRFIGKTLVFGLKLPWKARIYTINNDAWQLRHPAVTIRIWWYSDFWTHQCTREELERQSKECGLS